MNTAIIDFHGTLCTLNEAFDWAIEQQRNANYRQAEDMYRHIRAAIPNHVPTLNNLGFMLFQLEDVDEAITLLEIAIAADPYYFYAYNNLGNAYLSKGLNEKAEACFRKVLELKPGFARTLYNLSTIRKYTSIDDADAVAIRDALTQNPDAHDSEHLHFALGKIYDDCGQYEQAFLHYEQANRMCGVEYRADLIEKTVDEQIEAFPKESLKKPFAGASKSKTPIFIVGMPRSGTTLIANMLSNHPQVRAAGELLTIAEFTCILPEKLSVMVSYPYAADFMNADVCKELAETYETRLRRSVEADVTHVIDKHPINFRHLGFITRMFPNARIIHCRRNPLDTCLSNYFQYFSRQYSYSFDLANTAHYYREYERLMDYWRQALPKPMLEVSYDEAVESTEGTVRRMLEFLGLPWHDACLEPHKNPRVVKTASMWQVRQPIYRKSLERWRNYEKYVEPLKTALTGWGVSLAPVFYDLGDIAHIL